MSDIASAKEIARVLGLAGDDFYQANASRGVPSDLTLAMARAMLDKFDIRLREISGSGGDNRT